MNAPWPKLDFQEWAETAVALHLWTQIVGKVRLATTPWLNHSWQVPLYVTARGLGTSAMPYSGGIFDMEFDFVKHRLMARASDGRSAAWPLAPQSVAAFYAAVMTMLRDIGVEVAIHAMPNEIADPIPFAEDDRPRPYDAEAVQRFFQALVRIDRILKLFRTGFVGKASPVHFFWGGFDLAATRFSGRAAPPHSGGMPGLPDAVMREAYSHEVSSAGFWPGGDALPTPAFYSYAYPEPPGFRDSRVTAEAEFNPTLGEFVLAYDAVRTASDPEALLLDFLSTTYAAAATAGKWDREALERPLGIPGRVQPATPE